MQPNRTTEVQDDLQEAEAQQRFAIELTKKIAIFARVSLNDYQSLTRIG